MKTPCALTVATTVSVAERRARAEHELELMRQERSVRSVTVGSPVHMITSVLATSPCRPNVMTSLTGTRVARLRCSPLVLAARSGGWTVDSMRSLMSPSFPLAVHRVLSTTRWSCSVREI